MINYYELERTIKSKWKREREKSRLEIYYYKKILLKNSTSLSSISSFNAFINVLSCLIAIFCSSSHTHTVHNNVKKKEEWKNLISFFFLYSLYQPHSHIQTLQPLSQRCELLYIYIYIFRKIIFFNFVFFFFLYIYVWKLTYFFI